MIFNFRHSGTLALRAERQSAYLCVALLCYERYIFIVECGIVRFLCAKRVFEVRASSSSPRLP